MKKQCSIIDRWKNDPNPVGISDEEAHAYYQTKGGIRFDESKQTGDAVPQCH